MKDVQAEKSNINIGINRVGIDNLKMPMFISKKEGGHQHTVADVSCYVDLRPELKGINMSRLPIAIHKFSTDVLDSNLICKIAEHIRIKSEAEYCQLVYSFPYFIKKYSPVNGEPGLVYYNVTFDALAGPDETEFKFKVTTIATTLCPCSKEISDSNAHNQKCYITIEVKPSKWIWIEDIISIAEKSSSCEIYSVLKRPDEKFVTEQMYANPRFVEDVVREAYSQLSNMNGVCEFVVEAAADESIHMHRAYAKLEGVLSDERRENEFSKS